MTIDSVAVTRSAVYNSSTNTAKLPSTNASGSIDLTIRSNDIPSRMVQCGVPIAESQVSNVSELIVFDENQQEIPAQFDILTAWPDGSIRVVLVTLKISADAAASKQYKLNYGAGVLQSAYSTNLSLTDNANDYTIDTGKIRVVIDKTSGQIIKSVHADTAGDQTYATQMLGQSDIFSQDALTDIQYFASNETAPTLTVMRNGINNIQIRSTGYLRDASNNTYTEFRVWIDLFNDSDEIQFEYSMVDDQPRLGKDTSSTFNTNCEFACRNVGWTFDHNIASNQKYIFAGESVNAEGDLTQEEYLLQSGVYTQNASGAISTDPAKSGLYGDDSSGLDQNYSGIQAGKRAKGYSTVHNGTLGITAMMPDFWERWPKELALDTAKITVSCYPDRYHGGSPTTIHTVDANGILQKPTALYHQVHGMAQTYRFKLKIHTATPNTTELDSILENYKAYTPELLCSNSHYCTSKFVYNLIPKDANSTIFDDALLNNVLLYSRSEHPQRSLLYNWRSYGDRLRTGWSSTSPINLIGSYNGTHVGGINYFILWMRSFNVEWLREAWEETRMFMDHQVMHCELRNWAKNPAFEPYPPGSINCGGHKDIDHFSAIGVDSHAHLSALGAYYWMTGNQRAKEVIKECSELRDHLVLYKYPSPRPVTYSNFNRAFSSSEREVAWDWFVALEYVKVFNDQDYFNRVCKRYADNLIEWWKQSGDHYITDAIVSYSDWQQGTGFWLKDSMDNSLPNTFSNSVIPWMLGMLLHTCVEFHKLEERYNSGVDLVEFRQMCYQAIQFMFDWGYDSTSKVFYYSAAVPNVDQGGGGPHMILSPLAWFYIKYKEDLAASNIANPAWFDDAEWKAALLYWYDHFKQTGKIPWRHHFYGYELIWPNEFWTDILTIEAE